MNKQQDTIVITQRFASTLINMAPQHSAECKPKDARKEGGRAIAMFCDDNGGLAARGGGYGLASEGRAKLCTEFTLSDLIRGKASGKPDSTFLGGSEFGFDHPAYFKRGRQPILMVSSPFDSRDVEFEEQFDGFRIVRTTLPSWYAPGSCSLDLVLPDWVSLRREDKGVSWPTA